MAYRVKIQGLKEITKLYRSAPEKTLRYTKEALQRSGDLLVENTIDQIKAKGLVDRGKMAQATRTYPIGPLQQVVEVDAKYAPGLEEGSEPHMPPIVELKGWARRKLGNEKLAYVVARSIARKGIKPRYFHREAIEMSLPRIDGFFGDVFTKVYNT
jgi:hypothetical protein